jgi:hypothetical protein
MQVIAFSAQFAFAKSNSKLSFYLEYSYTLLYKIYIGG